MRRLDRWLPSGLVVAFGVLLGLGLYTLRYAEGLSYLSNDPAACMHCHVMQEHYDSWVKSSHRAAATCNDCHVPHTFPEKYEVKARNGWNHSKAFTLQNFAEPIRIRQSNLATLQHNCIACHSMAVSEIAGHRDVELWGARCTQCHRSVGHMSTF
jgi:cytochrome c nitrite reductase small subunit